MRTGRLPPVSNTLTSAGHSDDGTLRGANRPGSHVTARQALKSANDSLPGPPKVPVLPPWALLNPAPDMGDLLKSP